MSDSTPARGEGLVPDLLLLAARLRAARTEMRLAGMIKRFADASSSLEDLRASEFCLAQVIGVSELHHASADKTLPAEVGQLGRAFAFQAIIHYARATDTSSRHRVGFSVRGWLTEEQKSMHARVMSIRNDVIAHFGYGTGPRSWHVEYLTLADDGTPRFLYDYANYIATDMNFLGELLEVVGERARAFTKEIQGALSDEIARVVKCNAMVREFFCSPTLDLRGIFPAELVHSFLNSPDAKEADARLSFVDIEHGSAWKT
ncbi:hypothetical protein [Sphingomonas adhaesiva]|uniref:hypothetical protein n=1 Tax=Sphingomonas adhaesiva TaxID=28212 RepID=UPI002FFB2E2C